MGLVSPSVAVRAACPEDKAAVVSFCRNTFSWGDYIPQVYDQWLSNPDGRLLVALVDDRPVALLHVVLLPNRVAWMEGMRVHPDLRRHGLATLIDAFGREFARESGNVKARLATSSKNLPAQQSLGRQGYRFLTRTDTWVAPPADVGNPFPTIATSRNVPAIMSLWEQSPFRTSCLGLVPDPDWRWTELTEERLLKQILNDQVRVHAGGFSVVPAYSSSDGSSEFSVHVIAGDADSIRSLALSARAEAAYRGFPNLEAMLPSDDRLGGILSNAGYVREGGMLIYEIDL